MIVYAANRFIFSVLFFFFFPFSACYAPYFLTSTLEEIHTTTLPSHPQTTLTILDLGRSDDLERLRGVFLARGDIDGYVIINAVDDVQGWRNGGEK